MTLLARMLCRWLGCPAPGPGRRERAAEEAETGEPPEVSPDDLTAIRGIGIATENRLYRAGIKCASGPGGLEFCPSFWFPPRA